MTEADDDRLIALCRQAARKAVHKWLHDMPTLLPGDTVYHANGTILHYLG